MKMSHLRRAALILSLGTAISLSAAGAALAAAPAQPSARAAEAARVGAEMKAQLAYNPAGKIIDGNRISYSHGSMIVAFDVTPDFTCPSGSVCFFTKVNLKGTAYEALASNYSTDTFYLLQTWYPKGVRLGSVRNFAPHRIFVSSGKPGVVNLCYGPKGHGSPDELLNYVLFGKADTC
jgi:hypothetical protein